MWATGDLALRRTIFESFAATGAPPDVDPRALQPLVDHHWVVPDVDGRVLMAHPFAAHTRGARVEADGRTWWGNCAWDGLGIVAALELERATITAQGHTLTVADGTVAGDTVFHVLVPARHWWDDIGFT